MNTTSMNNSKVRKNGFPLRQPILTRNAGQRFGNLIRTFVGSITLTTAILIFSPSSSFAITETQAVRILVLEGANQGEKGMTAIAEVLRRRNPSAFSSLKRIDQEKFLTKQPKWVHEQAKRAWKLSQSTNVTRGATHYENIKRFGEPYWAKKMRVVAVVGDHTFFK